MSKILDDNFVVVGLVFGDESKGATVDWLAGSSFIPSTVVRFSGGCQAAHNVVADGTHHCFRQFGSGTLAGARTYLSQYMMVEPILLAHEAQTLESIGIENPFELLEVHPNALITTSFHKAANRTREDLRGTSRRHGSTGNGIGETKFYSLAYQSKAKAGSKVGNFEVYEDATVAPIRAIDCVPGHESVLGEKLEALADFYHPLIQKGKHMLPSSIEAFKVLTAFGRRIKMASQPSNLDRVIFEGSQGALLDQDYGWKPWVTWSNTTSDNAFKLAVDWKIEAPHSIGCTRTYTTRHGFGPFPSEQSVPFKTDEKDNGYGEYQGAWREGLLDLSLVRYGAKLNQVDFLSVSHLDITGPENLVVDFDGEEVRANIEQKLEEIAPIFLRANGRDRLDRIADLRTCLSHDQDHDRQAEYLQSHH